MSDNTQLTTGDYYTWIAFYISAALAVIAGLISILGNGLVLYVSNLKIDTGKMKYMNLVVKHLAACDLLFGLIGTPFTILFWYMG